MSSMVITLSYLPYNTTAASCAHTHDLSVEVTSPAHAATTARYKACHLSTLGLMDASTILLTGHYWLTPVPNKAHLSS